MSRVILSFGLFFLFPVTLFCQTARYKLKRSQTFYVPETVNETSGLFYFDGELVTQNDSGGENRLYVLDTLGGEIKRSIAVPGSVNRDWEALTVSDGKLYIGDFGNNSGLRKDLTIYIADLSSLPASLPVADSIRFRYPEQTVFEKKGRNHDFDCEAMVVFRDSVYLYSKGWADGFTTIRTLPARPGEYAARTRSRFDAGGLVTDAAFDAQRNLLVWVGYSLESQILQPFVWLFHTDHPAKINRTDGVRVTPDPAFTQVEGVAILPSGKLAITAEGISSKWLDIAPALFLVWPRELTQKTR